ncbi:flagellin [Dyella kyungheensis]|jgi:flagellin|uniref:Flagellin n=1 Tax=Dyella kyungheensis TaxID=1242174 RepID=A0ABS2JTU4_9GAMM|nr:flagellin [Dyella kyungheensis]MBM7122429.1 flagellin/flagellar hook associated protein [Dyella kyungheensis]
MSLVINTNISSLNAQNNLTKSQSALSTATQRLSSGLKINSAADNAAGFAISQRYTTQIGGLGQASANASDAINLAQTAGSALDQVTANLQAIRDLAVQSANGTYTDGDRASIDQEVQQRLAEITRIANQTTFNGSNVLDGSMKTKSFQIGADVGQTISVSLGTSVKSSAMGQVAEVASGDISNAFKGFTLAAGALNVSTDGGTTNVAVAAGTYHSAGDLAAAINTAAGSTVASVDSTTGELKINNGGTAALNFSGAAATTLGLPATTAAAGTGASTGVVAATGDLSKEGLTINGTAIDLSSAKSLQDVSDAINAAGITGVSAAVNGAGNGINFYSAGALTVGDTKGQIVGASATDVNAGATYTQGTSAATGGSLATGSVGTVDSANDLISRVDVALKTVSDFAAQLGAVQNRFQSTISTVAAQTTNLQASQSTIQDADFAAETANLSKAQVLQQAGISVLAQANSNPQQVLKLLQ